MRSPEMDVVETEDEILIVAELPGLRREDIEVSLQSNVLTIRDKAHSEQRGVEQKYHVVERRFGTFIHSFVLPRGVDADAISAHFIDGVLEVRVAKTERVRRHAIEVQNSVLPGDPHIVPGLEDDEGRQRRTTGPRQREAEGNG